MFLHVVPFLILSSVWSNCLLRLILQRGYFSIVFGSHISSIENTSLLLSHYSCNQGSTWKKSRWWLLAFFGINRMMMTWCARFHKLNWLLKFDKVQLFQYFSPFLSNTFTLWFKIRLSKWNERIFSIIYYLMS